MVALKGAVHACLLSSFATWLVGGEHCTVQFTVGAMLGVRVYICMKHVLRRVCLQILKGQQKGKQRFSRMSDWVTLLDS